MKVWSFVWRTGASPVLQVKTIHSPDVLADQMTLDDIEKSVNDDMKRIIPWLQQLK